MEFKLVADLLNLAGAKTSYTIDRLEQVPFPYENYALLKKDGDKWVYGFFVQERTNNPYMSVRETFDTKEEGSRYFFLKQLSTHFFNSVITTFRLKHIGSTPETVEDLYKSLQMADISHRTFCVDDTPYHTCVHLKKVNSNESILSLVSQGKTIKSSIPLDDYPWAVRLAFRSTFLLHLFQTEVPKLLQSEGFIETFTDEEMATFVW